MKPVYLLSGASGHVKDVCCSSVSGMLALHEPACPATQQVDTEGLIGYESSCEQQVRRCLCTLSDVVAALPCSSSMGLPSSKNAYHFKMRSLQGVSIFNANAMLVFWEIFLPGLKRGHDRIIAADYASPL